MQVAIASLLAVPDRPTPPDRLLAALSDDDLLRGLSHLLAQSRRVESDLVGHIAEVDARRLWARQAFPSMFAYCTGALSLSESEAYLRIAVGRTSREYPPILQLLAEGRAHLSGIALLAPHLTPENAERLLARAAFKSKREIEELVAELAPRPDVRAAIRKLPSSASSASSSASSASAPSAEVMDAQAPSFEEQPPVVAVIPSAISASSTLSRMGRTVTPAIASAAPSASPESIRTCSPRPFQPLAPDRYKVQFTATGALIHKLERLRALMSPRIPGGDLSAVIDAVVTEKLERIEARRFGAKPQHSAIGRAGGGHPTVARPSQSDGNGSATRRMETIPGPAAAAEAPARPCSRYIPASVRRAVRDRDGGRCAYVDTTGRRCTERDQLDFHHRHPFGFGGNHRPENICMMCRAHNALQAEHDFGANAIARFRPGARRMAVRSPCNREP